MNRRWMCVGAPIVFLSGLSGLSGACTVTTASSGNDASTGDHPAVAPTDAASAPMMNDSTPVSSAEAATSPDASAPEASAPSDGGPPDSSLPATISNVQPGSIDFSGTSDIVIGGAIDATGGTILNASKSSFKYFQLSQSGGGPMLAVFVAHSFQLAASVVGTVYGSLPLVLVAEDRIDIFGQLLASARHRMGVAGGFVCSPTGAGAGPGGGGAGIGFNAGGGGGYCGAGGNGNATSDAGLAGMGGVSYGSQALVPLIGGSAGGGTGINGGAGGGAIQLVAGGSITIGLGGVVSVGGGGGENGGGAGGSGGAILIEAPVVTVAGTLAANGGGAEIFTGGGGGQDGQPNSTPAQGDTVNAGTGSAGTMINGGNGSETAGGVNSSGAGGGGAGRIRINSLSGQASITGTVSPARTTTCFSQGQL